MAYVDGYVAAVPTANRDAYTKMAGVAAVAGFAALAVSAFALAGWQRLEEDEA